MLLCIQCKSQTEIRMNAAFVKLVKDQQSDPVQFGIRMEHAGEDAFSEDLDAGGGADYALTADAVAHSAAHRFLQLLRHELCGTARRPSARLQHEDFFSARQTGLQQDQRKMHGLACARRCAQHHPPRVGQAGDQIRHNFFNGEMLDVRSHEGLMLS